jgi:hypothetical protein
LTIYVAIAILGFFIKLAVSHRVLFRFPFRDDAIKPEAWVVAIIFIPYSIPQILLLAPDTWGSAIGLERYMVLRLYLYHGTLALIAGTFMAMSLVNLKFHRSRVVLAVIITYVIVGGYLLMCTDILVPMGQVRQSLQMELGPRTGHPAVFVTRVVVVILLTSIMVYFYRRYRFATNHRIQISSLYVLAAGVLFYLNCVASLFTAHPLIFATRGIFFFIGIMLVTSDRRIFDARLLTPITKEHRAIRRLIKTFEAYSNEAIGHREAVKEIEQAMVSYKLQRVTGFKTVQGSSLPQVAESMQVSLSSLYDLLKRLDLEKPRK